MAQVYHLLYYKQIMNHYIQITKSFVTTHKKESIVGGGITIVLVVIALLFLYNMPKDSYAAVKACDLLTPTKAEDLLGDKVLSVDTNAPVISENTATSKCSYTDKNPDKTKMKVVAIAVRSGLNNKSVKKNKDDFVAKKPSQNVKAVKDIGDSAYFNTELGQLNVLDGHEWLILSYGFGESPQDNTLDNAVKLAKKILR